MIVTTIRRNSCGLRVWSPFPKGKGLGVRSKYEGATLISSVRRRPPSLAAEKRERGDTDKIGCVRLPAPSPGFIERSCGGGSGHLDTSVACAAPSLSRGIPCRRGIGVCGTRRVATSSPAEKRGRGGRAGGIMSRWIFEQSVARHDRARTARGSHPSITVHARSQRMNCAGHPLSQRKAREGTRRRRQRPKRTKEVTAVFLSGSPSYGNVLLPFVPLHPLERARRPRRREVRGRG
jgi:hypothetical protein